MIFNDFYLLSMTCHFNNVLLHLCTTISVIKDNQSFFKATNFVSGRVGFTAGTILFSWPLPGVKAATNLSGIWSIFYFQKYFSRSTYLVFKSKVHVLNWKVFTVFIGRKGELGRIIDVVEEEDCQQLSETTREENYQTAADCNLSCSGREIGHRVVKCHRYDGYFRVKMLAGGVKVSFLLVLSNSGAKTVTICVFFQE